MRIVMAKVRNCNLFFNHVRDVKQQRPTSAPKLPCGVAVIDLISNFRETGCSTDWRVGGNTKNREVVHWTIALDSLGPAAVLISASTFSQYLMQTRPRFS